MDSLNRRMSLFSRSLALVLLIGATSAADAADKAAVQGATVQGAQLNAAPGYVLERGANNQVRSRPRTSGIDLDFSCGCTGGTGECGVELSGDVAICHRASVSPCSGTCAWDTAKTKVAPRTNR